MLHPGLYEQVINNALTSELAEIPEARKSVAPIDRAEASKVLAQYLADVVQKGLDNVLDNGGDISAQIGLTNQIVDLIQNTTKEAGFAALGVDQRAEQLLALLREADPRLAVGKTAADIERPETSIAQSSLFTGAVHEPQMFTELKKEIVSADRIDMLVSFIKWSGLRLIMDELREFTQNGGELRIITTSYMGATDVKAIEELRKLPNTHIKVSYNTKTTRLHAKAYIFYRETGFTTAYVGSSNLSNAALTSGLEWNTKATVKAYSTRSMADFKARILECHFGGMYLEIDGREVGVQFIGKFNVSNLLAVYGAAVMLGKKPEDVLVVMSTLHSVSGRLEPIQSPEGYTAIVDYAHTPDALENVLNAIHEVLDGKGGEVITVCGAGGNRDKGKRPLMAQEAVKQSDKVIITSDNPRFEEPQDIINDMLAGLNAQQMKKVISIVDRKEAIRTACMLAKKGDVILVAGKGHEDYQEIKGVKHHFDDKEVLREIFGINK